MKNGGRLRVRISFVHLREGGPAAEKAELCLKNQIQGRHLMRFKGGVDRILEEVLRCSYTRKYKEKDVEKHLEPIRNRF